MDTNKIDEAIKRRRALDASAGSEAESDEALGVVRAGRVYPGGRWGRYSGECFDRTEEDIATLGRVATGIILRLAVQDDPVSVTWALERFASAAEPPIASDDLPVFEQAAMSVYANHQMSRVSGGVQ